MPTAIFCSACGTTGTVAKVTPGLQCRCGSTDLGLDGVDPKPSHALQSRTAGPEGYSYQAAEPDDDEIIEHDDPRFRTRGIPRGLLPGERPEDRDRAVAGYPHASRTAAGGSGWFKPMPDNLRGWDEYPGPEASPNPERVRDANPRTCPACDGSGYDLIDKCPCRACHGSGTWTPTTSAPPVQSYDPHAVQHPGGAGWHGASVTPSRTTMITRTVTDPHAAESKSKRSGVQPPTDQGVRRPTASSAGVTAPSGVPVYPLATATCPVCRVTSTHLAADRSGHAWWCCGKCGSLADLDVRYDVDPFDPPQKFHRQTGMRTKASKLRKTPQDGRLLRLVAAVHEQNSVTPQEALTLARATLAKYPA